MHAFILTALTATLALGSAGLIVAIQRRAASCERPDDATVTAVFTIADRPSDGQTVVAVVIANPGRVPVLAGLSLRRALLPGRYTRATTGSRTTRRRYQAARHEVVAAVPDDAISRICVPVPGTRSRYRLVVVIGQSDGRLRIISAPVTIALPGATTALFPA